MITAQVTSQGLQVSSGFPDNANQNRFTNSNVEPEIGIAITKRRPDVVKNPTLNNAYYFLAAAFHKDSNNNIVPTMEKDEHGADHQAVRQIYPSLFIGDIATVIVDPADPEIMVGSGPRMHPTGEAADIFSRFSLRNDAVSALYDKCHQDSANPDNITHVIWLKLQDEPWTINRNRTGAGANPSRHVKRKVYNLPIVALTTPVVFQE